MYCVWKTQQGCGVVDTRWFYNDERVNWMRGYLGAPISTAKTLCMHKRYLFFLNAVYNARLRYTGALAPTGCGRPATLKMQCAIHTWVSSRFNLHDISKSILVYIKGLRSWIRCEYVWNPAGIIGNGNI